MSFGGVCIKLTKENFPFPSYKNNSSKDNSYMVKKIKILSLVVCSVPRVFRRMRSTFSFFTV